MPAADKVVATRTLAGILGLSVVEVHELAKVGRTVKVSGLSGKFLFETSVRNYVRHLREIAAGRQGNELNAVDENARLKMAQRRNYDLKNSILEGSAIPQADLIDAWGAIVRTAKACFRSRRDARKKCRICVSRTLKFRRGVLTEAATIMPDNPPLRDGPDAPRKRWRPPGPGTSFRP